MQNRIVIFDLDGTIYQNSVFHRGYLRTLVAGTWAEPLEADLVRLAEAIFAGRELDINRFTAVGVQRPPPCRSSCRPCGSGCCPA